MTLSGISKPGRLLLWALCGIISCGQSGEEKVGEQVNSGGTSSAGGGGGAAANSSSGGAMSSSGGAASSQGGSDGCGEDDCSFPAPCAPLPSDPQTAGPPMPIEDIFAATEMFLGDTDWSGKTRKDAWEIFGINLDGMETKSASESICEFVPPSPSIFIDPAFPVDGRCGSDNAFGHAQVLFSPDEAHSKKQTARIIDGEWTLLLSFQGLTPSGGQSGVSGRVFSAAPRGSKPTFDGNDLWSPAIFEGESTDGKWTGGYLNGIHFVSTTTSLTLPLFVYGTLRKVHLERAQVLVQFSNDKNEILRGLLVGIIQSATLNTGACSPGGFLPNQKFSDISIPGKDACEGASFGIGFRAKRAKLGEPAPAPPLPPPCP